MNKKTAVIITAVAIAAGTAGFFSGTMYQKNTARSGNSPFINDNGTRGSQMGFAGGAANGKRVMMGGGMVAGEILSIDGSTMTIKIPDGGSKIVLISDSTKVMRSTEIDKNEVKTGENVTVNGKTNEDGSVSANSIQIRPVSDKPVSAPQNGQ